MSNKLELAKDFDKRIFISMQDKKDALDEIMQDLKTYYKVEKEKEA